MLKNEPVLTITGIAAAIVTVCALFNVVLDTSAVETVVAVIVPLVAGLVARSKVSPVK